MTPVGAPTTGCENPTGLDFHGTVSWVVPPPPPSTTWCSPGFWKNHNSNPPWPVTAGNVPYQNLLYNSFSNVYAHDPKVFDAAHPPKYNKGGVDNPTLQQVISNPPAYGGEATNNVADILSKQGLWNANWVWRRELPVLINELK